MTYGTTSNATLSRLESAVAATVAIHPELVAIEATSETLTYSQLWARAGQWAGAIRPLLNGERRVGLLVDRNPATYAAYLGILRAGGTVVPLSAGGPRNRLKAIADLAALPCLVWAGTGDVPLGPGWGIPVLDGSRVAGQEVDDCEPGGENVAYVLFTSGSTGRPKGVPISHANAVAFVKDAVERYGLGPGARMSQSFDLTFDVSVYDLFGAWASGATLVVPGRTDLLHPVRWVNQAQISHWASVPSVITAAEALGELQPAAMPNLEVSMFIGEPLSISQAEAWSKSATNSRVINFYGPTELTVAISSYVVDTEAPLPETSNRTVPIGTVYEHLDWTVVGPDNGSSDEGELCVRGSQRFDGYLDPADNAGRFLNDDLSELLDGSSLGPSTWYRTGDRVKDLGAGRLLHLGRLDDQIKVRGYRVEIGEVESALRSLLEVTDCVVLPVTGRLDQTELVSFVVGTVVPDRKLRTDLAAALPTYMVPKRFIWLDELPLTVSGKRDRVRLKTFLTPPVDGN